MCFINLWRSNPAASFDPRVGFTAFSVSLANRNATGWEEFVPLHSAVSVDGILFPRE